MSATRCYAMNHYIPADRCGCMACNVADLLAYNYDRVYTVGQRAAFDTRTDLAAQRAHSDRVYRNDTHTVFRNHRPGVYSYFCRDTTIYESPLPRYSRMTQRAKIATPYHHSFSRYMLIHRRNWRADRDYCRALTALTDNPDPSMARYLEEESQRNGETFIYRIG